MEQDQRSDLVGQPGASAVLGTEFPAIVIVSHDGLELTKGAVRTALAQDIPSEVLVVDNASSDNTISWLKARDGIGRMFIHPQKSLAACWNDSLRALFKFFGRTSALVLNNDVEIRPDTLRMLLDHGGDFVTCVSVDDRERIGTPGDRRIEDLRLGERPHPDFSAFLIRKSVTDRMGFFFNEECFPAYVEDCFAHVEMVRAGFRPVCIDLPFYHAGAHTIRSASPGERERIGRMAQANREKFRARYGCLPGTPEYEDLFREVRV